MSFTSFTIYTASVDPFKYGDALALVRGHRLKMESEGYTDTVAPVLRSVRLDTPASVAIQDPGDVKDVSSS